MKTIKELFAWMDKQIEAYEIQNTPLDTRDKYYVCIAGSTDSGIHIYNIDHLYDELMRFFGEHLDISLFVEPCINDMTMEKHYFMYKGCKFFGLAAKGEYDARK